MCGDFKSRQYQISVYQTSRRFEVELGARFVREALSSWGIPVVKILLTPEENGLFDDWISDCIHSNAAFCPLGASATPLI
jgi:hypothetical protein